jgi:uncharacterized protein YgfB (UPF0149 family)
MRGKLPSRVAAVRTRLARVAVAALACAVTVAGCGGGGGLSKKQLAGRANAICARYATEGQRLGRPDLSVPNKAEDYFVKAAALARRQQAELAGLHPADDVKADYEKLTKATGDATKLLSDLAAAAKARDQQKRDELIQQLRPISEAVDSTAKVIGADDCAG